MRCRLYLDDLQLDALVRLWTLEAVADGFHQPVDQPLTGSSTVGGVARDVAISNQLLQWGERAQVRATLFL